MSPAARVLDWQPVAETLTALDAQYAGLDQLVEELFGELEKRRTELAQKAAELDRHRQEADARRRDLQHEREENRRLAEQFEQQERRLAEALALLEHMKHGLEAAPARIDASAAPEHLQSALERLTGERDALRAELENARAGAAQWSQLTAEMERWGVHLEERLAKVAPRVEGGADSQAVALLEQERAALAAELEQVRARSAELHESLRQQQREHAEHNARLADEIQQLRELVERQAEMLAELARDGAPTAEKAIQAVAASRSESAAPASDPVVSSVMAQFAQLQRDVVKRRKRK